MQRHMQFKSVNTTEDIGLALLVGFAMTNIWLKWSNLYSDLHCQSSKGKFVFMWPNVDYRRSIL